MSWARSVSSAAVVGAALPAIAAPDNAAGLFQSPGRVRFHQDWLAQRSDMFVPEGESRPGVYRGSVEPEADQGVHFDSPRSVFEFVLKNSPNAPIVFPSEQYYYYEFSLGERAVSGNLRFTEADEGKVNIGYFDRADRGAMYWAAFSAEDGVGVTVSEDPDRVTVTSGQVSRTFLLYQGAFGNESDIRLLDDETYVSGVVDESGYFFHLLYSENHRAFYYVLQSNKPTPEPLVRLDRLGEHLPRDLGVLLGADSRFVFISDDSLGRTVLVGVHADQTAANTYFDGPFDQVPPDLPIKALIENAYPYVTYGGGIDDHGNFIDRAGQRVAISPYFDYTDFDGLKSWFERTTDPDASGVKRWIGSVLEPKRYFHRTLERHLAGGGEAVPYTHDDRISYRWPAGHWLPASSTWTRRGDTPD